MRVLILATLAALAPTAAAAQVCEAQWTDPARNGRVVPVRIRMPPGSGKVPVILFSHGLGGSLDAGTRWAQAWVADGEAVIHLQHAGSDSAILRGGGLRNAMTGAQLRARVDDVGFVLDQLATRRSEGACDLRRLDLTRAGMSGHSFGAQTTLAVAGERFRSGKQPPGRRVKAAIAFSPQPAMALDDATAFGGIAIPFLSITGTKDELGWLNQVTAADRERPFRAMPPGGKYLLVLAGGTHANFSGQEGHRRMLPPTPPHIADTVVHVTTLFWRATLKGDAAARRALDEFASAVGTGDRFEKR